MKDYRVINGKDKQKFVKDKLSKLTLHEKLQKLNFNFMMHFDATSLHPSAMWDEKPVFFEKKELDFLQNLI